MSTKIFTGSIAKAAQPFAWGQNQGGSVQHYVSAGQGGETQKSPEAAELERQMESRVRQAHDAGRREGEEAASRQLGARVDAQISKLAQGLAELASLRARVRREAEIEMVQLSVAVARKILNRDTQTDPDALVGVFKAALQKVESREVLRVRVSPHHADSLRRNIEQAGLPQRIDVQADPGLEAGGIVLETTQGSLDASIETQLQEIEHGLVDRVKGQ